jgi:hypothetical protein
MTSHLIELTFEFPTDRGIWNVCCNTSVKFFDGGVFAILLGRTRAIELEPILAEGHIELVNQGAEGVLWTRNAACAG